MWAVKTEPRAPRHPTPLLPLLVTYPRSSPPFFRPLPVCSLPFHNLPLLILALGTLSVASGRARLLGIEIDTPVASFAIQALQKLQGGGPTEDQKKSVKILLDSITSSKAWPRFMEVLKTNNVGTLPPVSGVSLSNNARHGNLLTVQ